MERRIKIKTLNPYITCKICKGYLIDATTVTECLHTFCKSCLVKHLEDNNSCPSCDIVIHQSHPLQYISFDRTMQDMVYKLVPDLQDNEMKREREFYRGRGLPYPKPIIGKDAFEFTDEKDGFDANTKYVGSRGGIKPDPAKPNHANNNSTTPALPADFDYHRKDEQVNICLECSGVKFKHLSRKFIRCSSMVTITHLKKFVAKKVFNSLDKYKDVEILCDEQILGKDHTLKFICITKWRFKDPPLQLQYRPRAEL